MVEHLLDLGEDLIAEILTHLPTGSILVARAVCEDFRRVATSAAFLAAHARRRPLEILLYDRTTTSHVDDYVYLDALSVSVRHPGRPARRPLARLPATKPLAELLGEQFCLPLASCDGLLLLGTVFAGQYLVSNPATRQWAELPRVRRQHIEDGGRSLESLHTSAYQESGFYFHEPSGEYRLLCHVTIEDDWPAAYAAYYVFSTGANEPRRLDNVKAGSIHAFFSPSRCDMITPAVLRGRLHWLRHPEAGSAGEMAAFDTVDETFRRMPAPPVANDLLARLLVADGSLMASEFRKLAVDLWVLEGYAGAASASTGKKRWELRHRFEVPWQARMPTSPQIVVGGDEEGDVVLGTSHGVAVYDVRSGTVRAVDVGPGGSKGVILTQRALRLRESLVRHEFFETQRHPGIPSLYRRFCSC